MSTQVILLLLSASFNQLPSSELTVIDVCDILQTPQKYRGQIVAVKGLADLSQLRSENTCESIPSAPDKKWPKAIHLSHGTSTDLARAVGDLTFDQLHEITNRELKQGKKPLISAVYVGLLRAREKYGPQIAGFGPYGLFPVELQVQFVRQLRINEREPHDGLLLK